MDNKSPLRHADMLPACKARISAVQQSPRERADLVARVRVVLGYLEHRASRAELKRRGGFWGRRGVA